MPKRSKPTTGPRRPNRGADPSAAAKPRAGAPAPAVSPIWDAGGGAIGTSETAPPIPFLPALGRPASNVLAAVALCLLVAASFFPATMGGFVWDDSVWTDPGPVQSPSGLGHIWFEPSTLSNEGHYWPVPYTLLWLEYRLWELAPLGYHIVNLVLHAGVTLLLWRLLLRLRIPGAWVVAAVFAVHPLHVESVAWVIGRKDILAALFYLTSVLLYMRFMETGRWWLYAGVLAMFVLGLFSKSIAVTMPVALLILHWWKQGRVTGADLKRVAPLLLVALAVTVFDLSLYRDRDPIDLGYSPIERVLIAARALAFYVGKLLWPANLAVIYPRWEVGVGDVLAWGYLVAALSIVALLWFYRGRIGRGPLAGVLVFVITLSPILGLVEYGYMKFSFVAERYQYLAGAALMATLLGAAAYWMRERPSALRAGVPVMVAGLLAMLGTITWNQSGIYRSNLTFYGHVASLNPKARFAQLMLGREYQMQGRLDEAHAAYRAEHRYALEQDPPDHYRLSNVHLGLGAVAEARGQLEEAEAHYRSGISFPGAFRRLINLLNGQERYDEVLALHKDFLADNPWSAKLQFGLGMALLRLNRHDEALRSLERAIELDPYFQEPRRHREQLLRTLNREAE